MALRITERRARGKARCISCCVCETPHPKDPTTGRMAEHAHQGRKCLGGDIPFVRHADPPTGKIIGWIGSRVPMPRRARAIQIAEDGGLDPRAIGDLLAEPWSQDFHVLWWIDRMMGFARKRQLDDECGVARRRPRLVERRARS